MLDLALLTIHSFLSENLLPDWWHCPPWGSGNFHQIPVQKNIHCVFAFHHDLINYSRKLHFILLAKMRVIRTTFDPFFSTPLSLQWAVKCDKLILKYILLCQEQISPTWLAAPPQEFGIVCLRIWHPAFLSDEIEKKCPPDDTTALSIEGSELVFYLNICGNNWTLLLHVEDIVFIPSLNLKSNRARDMVRVITKYTSTQRISFESEVLNFSGVLKQNLWYILGCTVG